jgi:hypothetical protein
VGRQGVSLIYGFRNGVVPETVTNHLTLYLISDLISINAPVPEGCPHGTHTQVGRGLKYAHEGRGTSGTFLDLMPYWLLSCLESTHTDTHTNKHTHKHKRTRSPRLRRAKRRSRPSPIIAEIATAIRVLLHVRRRVVETLL